MLVRFAVRLAVVSPMHDKVLTGAAANRAPWCNNVLTRGTQLGTTVRMSRGVRTRRRLRRLSRSHSILVLCLLHRIKRNISGLGTVSAITVVV